MKKKIFLFVLIFLFPLSGLFSQENKIKVIAEKANIHFDPDVKSSIIETVEKGTILTLISPGKIRSIWYYVTFYSKKRSSTLSGFIQASLVERVEEIKEVIEEEIKKPLEKKPPEKKEPIKKIEEVFFEAPKNIKVISKKANVRAEPRSKSQVIHEVKSGTILQSGGKAGEWFSVSLPPDKDGVVLSGYIHQNFVEEFIEKVPEVPKVVEKKPKVVKKKPKVIKEKPKVTPVKPPKIYRPKKIKIGPKSSIGAIGGYAMPSENNYNNGIKYGGGFSLGIFKYLSLEVCGLRFQSDVEGSLEGLSKGKLAVMPVQLSIQARLPVSSRFVPYLLGGGGYYINSFKLDGEIADNWEALGFTIEEKVENVFGYHFGAGIDFFFTKSIALNLDARYCLAKVKGSWTLTDQIGGTQTSGDLEDLNLNSFVFGAGLKFCFQLF